MPSIGVRFRPEQIEECDRQAEALGLASRNDFIRNAVDFYTEFLHSKASVKFLTPALESVIGAKVRDSEERIRNVEFKMAVQIAMLTKILMDYYEYSDEDIEALREDAVRQVKETNGSFRM